MTYNSQASVHTFHIPVMGTGFSIDTPLKVARFGISSVISLVDDTLIEQMRRYHSVQAGEPYVEISSSDLDVRAKRITAYLDLLDRLIDRQVRELKQTPFEPGSDITRYFEQLPPSFLRDDYLTMLGTTDHTERTRMQNKLRERVTPGAIDVNVMTKLDCNKYVNGIRQAPEYSDAKAALRGFANSTVRSSIVCSAGINREFYSYFSTFDGFYPDSEGDVAKKIVLKVSDFRSAQVQGRFLAKQGLWVSEYRIESGLNCGGHAFPTKGLLLGPIIEEFRRNRAELTDRLFPIYRTALETMNRPVPEKPSHVRVTVQGGIGTAAEHQLLLDHYGIESAGWGTPFLLVPEAVNIDEDSLNKIVHAESRDVYLSGSSPLGVPFWNLRTSASEEMRRKRIVEERPGSPCRKGHLRFIPVENEMPICRASMEYQKNALATLDEDRPTPDVYERKRNEIIEKSCICHDLAGVVTLKLGIDSSATPAICCGPNIVNFSKIATLREMIDHIYGRFQLPVKTDRLHMFTRELMLYIDYYRELASEQAAELTQRSREHLDEFKANLAEGIEYYLNLADRFGEEQRERFLEAVRALQSELECIQLAPAL